ncbi:segregation and condensation protein A [Methylogaea oryzae]|uniref:Segregation and condensation protein A n=1 Tax=Methylogaea oryzae TaxID=1295382 RepID=A0A8D4VPK5_9GAMM|nr:ScpA family protein [Methylogaea oryzae]BBL70317.1 segregation and condensation protein A [Methylogaea oryzae]
MTQDAAPAEQPAVAAPLAVVRGAPLTELPADLYIPPDALEVFLETFEGPLDLLLYLIKRQNIDILDIPMAVVTRQYIDYIGMMGEMRMELAAEYLLMAAYLAEIKSRLLLPRSAEAEAEEEDPRAELVRRLQEYEVFKQAAQDLDALPRMDRDVFEVDTDSSRITVKKVYPELELGEVIRAFRDVLKRVDQTSHHHIQREPLSVRERMSTVLQRVSSAGSLAFSQLFVYEEGRHGAVVSLLAILELAKEGLIEIVQEELLGHVEVRQRTA